MAGTNFQDKFLCVQDGPSWVKQTTILIHRNFLNMMRNFGIFWMRLAMYVILCIGLGFVYFQLGHEWWVNTLASVGHVSLCAVCRSHIDAFHLQDADFVLKLLRDCLAVRRTDVYSRTALIFFAVAFLTFMSIAAFPAFIEEMEVKALYFRLLPTLVRVCDPCHYQRSMTPQGPL